MAVQHDVFISYATPDKTTADTICHFLEAEGVRCWIAPRDIPPGGDWPTHIPSAIKASRLMVLVFSENANTSFFVQREVTLSAAAKLPLIPFRVEDVLPKGGLEFHLVNVHWLNALTPPLAAHVRSLVTRVCEVLGRAPSERDAGRRVSAEEVEHKLKEEEEGQQHRAQEPGNPVSAPKRSSALVMAVLLLVLAAMLYPTLRSSSNHSLPHSELTSAPTAAPPQAQVPTPAPAPQPPPAPVPENTGAAAETPKAGGTRTFAGVEMVWCPPGEFMMGSGMEPSEVAKRYGGDEKFYGDTKPVHRVRFAQGFWMGRHEVTNAEFGAFVKATGHKTDAEEQGSGWGFNKNSGKWEDTKGLTWRNPGLWTPQPGEPVVLVSWNDARAYVEWLNKQPDGGGFGLPGEAQWEYACRAGARHEFFWGDDPSGGKGYLNACGGEGLPGGFTVEGHFDFNDGYEAVAPAGSFKPNPWGLYDMHGNVWEWCQDWHHDSYTGAPTDGSAWENPKGDYRVLRGGSWGDLPGFCRAAFRYGLPDVRSGFHGFRLSRTP